MKLTNKMGLPQAIVNAVNNDSYSGGGADFSVTTLLSPPRQVVLKGVHADSLVEDASDRIWSLMGQSVHVILERAANTGFVERRLTVSVDGVSVSGGMDAYYPSAALLQDYKVTSAWKLMGNGVPAEWEEQLNSYAELLRKNGDPIESLQVVAILRDWSKMEAKRNPDYPQCQVATVQVPLWAPEKAKVFLRNRVRLHLLARTQLPECSSVERWERPTKYAVMKKGAKRALKLYDTFKGAMAHAAKEIGLSVEKRSGESVRCQYYCIASSVCEQFKQTQKKENENDV